MEVQVKNGKVSEMLVPSAALAVPFAVMDRRRPGAVGAMHGSMGVPRPSSAPRRRHVAEPRKELLKQSSVPNLAQVPDRLGDGNARARRSAQVQAAYDPRAMRRAASATTLGARPDRREDYASRMAAGRPLGGRYDSSMFHPSEPLGRQSMGGFPKADALQLESRLTQRLREHSFNSMEPTRRPSRRKGQVLLGAAPEYRERDRLSQSLQGRSPMYRTAASTAWPEGVPLSGSFSNFGTPNRRPLHSTTSSPYQPSTYSQFGGAPTESGESSLKIYSDLFEEVIERDRVFGPLLRKVKSAYDSMLHSQDASTFAPLDGTAGSLRASHEPRGRSSEPTIRAEVTTSEPWELHRENQALKDLIERLHMELEEAVKREQRWKTKAAKLKARFSSPMTQAVHQHQGLQGWMPGDQGYPDWACHEGDLMNLQPGAMRSSAAFQANRREPVVSEVQAADLLNQAHLMSLSSISPQHSQLQRSMMEPLDHGSARSEDSGAPFTPRRVERMRNGSADYSGRVVPVPFDRGFKLIMEVSRLFFRLRPGHAMSEPEPLPFAPHAPSGLRAVEDSAQAIRKYLDDLRVEVEQLEATVKELQQQAGYVRGQPSQPSSASVNVGGDTGFVLSSDQFEAFPRSLLNSLCTGRWSSLHSLDHEGRIFLDLDPTQFRAILDWAFENAERTERPRLAEASEPQAWGLDLLIRFLGLGEHQAVEPKVKIDPEDGTVCTYPEILCKYTKDYSGDEIRDYWLYSMEQARNVMPCYRPVVFAGVPLREQAQQHLDPLSCLLADHIRAIQDEGAELRQRKAQAQEELESLESERTGLKLLGGRASRLDEESPMLFRHRSHPISAEDIVYFNAAGRLLATSRQTLLHCGQTALASWSME
eukprot:s410_g9.t1